MNFIEFYLSTLLSNLRRHISDILGVKTVFKCFTVSFIWETLENVDLDNTATNNDCWL